MKKLKICPDMMIRKERNFAFLFDKKRSRLYKLNETGMKILELCNGRNSQKDIIEHFKAKHGELSVDDIDSIRLFLRQSKKNFLVVEVS